MLALALNSSYLPDRLFAPSRLGTLFVRGVGDRRGGHRRRPVGSFRLGAYVAIEILPAAMAFVLMGLVSPGLFRRPGNAGPPPAATIRAGVEPAERARQRRGGRTKR